MVVTFWRELANRQSKSLRPGCPPGGRSRAYRPRLELLEDRTVLSTLYVDPSGRTPDGKDAYTTIQAAANAASPADTILVDPANYSENVTIPAKDTGLTLNGAKSGVNPVPRRSGAESVLNGTITISASGVTVDGFTVTVNAQLAIGTSATNIIIQNNIVNSSIYGIQIGPGGGNSTVRNNLVRAGNADIYVYTTSNNTVQGNDVTGSGYGGLEGIDLYYSNNDTVQYNNVTNCSLCAIRLRGSHDDLVQYNTGSGNGQPDIQEGEGSSGNTIQNNNFFPQNDRNLIINGDFEQGNTGFKTDYTYSPGNIGPARTYDILHDPHTAHPSAASYGDHTTGTGLMMAVNGATTPNVLLWGQTVSVTPNTMYKFSAYISSWTPSAPGQLDVLFNGTSIGTMNAPSTTAVWVQFSANWNSGAATSAAIELRNLSIADIGNDFALDDISLTGPARATATTVGSSVNPSVYGQPVNFTATVTSGGILVSTGTVTFQEGNTVLAASLPLDGSGHASFQIATLTAAGNPHSITAYYSGNASFAASSGSISQTVNKAPLSVTADDKTKVYGQPNPTFTAHYSGFVLGQDPSVLGGTLSLATPATISSNVGAYAITPSGLTSSNYAISFINGTLTVTPAPLIVIAANSSRTYGAANPALTGVIAGIQNGDPITATYGTSATPASKVGSYAIVPTLSDGGTGKLPNYTVTSTNGTLMVTPAPLAVVAANASRTYGSANPALTGAIAGLQNGDNITASFSTTATPASPVGSYAIIVSLSDPTNRLNNYTVTLNNGTLTVTPAALTVTPADVSRKFGTPNPPLSGAISGIQNGDNITANYSTTATPTSPVGTYPITATLNDASNKLGNYSVTLNQGTLTVTQSPHLVTTTADSGAGSFRQAILDADATPGPDTIRFAIGTGVQTIYLASPLPAITQSLVIDGTTQGGYAGAPLIVLNGVGAGPGADGLMITAGGSVVRGLVINQFSLYGIELQSAGGNVIQNDYVGTDVSGTISLGNGIGIYSNTSNNTIGGTAAGAGNVISGNEDGGVILTGSNNLVQGNYIGTDLTGTAALPNHDDGIRIAGGSNNLIGGTTPGAGNVISGNLYGDGVFISNGATGNLVQGNYIGTDRTGSFALGNANNGVRLLNASGNSIGGMAAGAGNVIAFNGNDGVLVDGGTANPIRQNSIFGHTTGLGIELVNGGNNQLPFPVLTSATSDGNTTTVAGLLQSTPNTDFTLEFFANPVCNPSGFGEGQQFLGSGTVTTNNFGTATFTVTFAVGVPPGQFLAATATDPTNNTSAFSNCVSVDGQVAPPLLVPGTHETGMDETVIRGPITLISALARSSPETTSVLAGRRATDVLFGKWHRMELRSAVAALAGFRDELLLGSITNGTSD